MPDLRLVFMGTPDFAVPSLRKLYEAGYTISGVVTAPDKPAGRGKQLKESAVKQFARKKGLTILQPHNLKDPSFQRALENLKPDLQVIVAFRKLPEAVWKIPPYGTFNLHASLLPDYRGAAPINWALINGETETGLTTFFLNNEIDTGRVILQERVPIDKHDSVGSLHGKLMEAGANLTKTTVEAIEIGKAEPYNQPLPHEAKKAPKITKETCRINWEWPLGDLYNFIRGLSPYPTAWTIFRGQQLKVFWAEPEEGEHNYPYGQLLPRGKDQLLVAAKGGLLKMVEVQIQGGKRLSAAEFRNGFSIPEGTFLDSEG
jgi:methionyl-tRNA formyltransferase